MAAKSYVLIETEVGRASEVAQGVQKLEGVRSADTIAGAYDVLATIHAADLDAVGTVIKQMHSISGICKTTTLIAMRF